LALSIASAGTNDRAQLSIFGTAGQQQVVQVSSNLAQWNRLATNLSGTNLFRIVETNTAQHRARFYRAVMP